MSRPERAPRRVTSGRLIAGAIVLAGLAMGVTVYYMQEYYYYETLDADDLREGRVSLEVTRRDGTLDPLEAYDFRGIDAESSPIRFRACFRINDAPQVMEFAAPVAKATPLNPPHWFDCFDARQIGEALETGKARAVLGQKDVHWGVDRVIALYPDGRGYAWQQINPCGEAVFNGKPAPAGCPPEPPES